MPVQADDDDDDVQEDDDDDDAKSVSPGILDGERAGGNRGLVGPSNEASHTAEGGFLGNCSSVKDDDDDDAGRAVEDASGCGGTSGRGRLLDLVELLDLSVGS